MAWEDDKSTAADPDNPANDEQLTADEWDAHVGEGHWLPDNAQLGQNQDGDPVVMDPQNGDAVILRYDRSVGEWVLPGLGVEGDIVDRLGSRVVYDESSGTVGDGSTSADHATISTDEIVNVAPSEGMAGIQDAIDNGYKRIRLGKGTYEGADGDQINIDVPNVTIEGEGWGTVLKFTEATTDNYIRLGQNAAAPNCTIRDLKLDGSNQNTSELAANIADEGCGVFVDDSTGNGVEYSLVEHVWFDGHPNEGWYGGGRGTDARALRATVKDCLFTGIGYRGLHPHTDHSVTVNNCIFKDMDGADVETGIRHGAHITDCKFENINGVAIKGSGDESTITNNQFYNTETCITTWGDHDHIVGNYFYNITTPDQVIRISESTSVVANEFYECTSQYNIRMTSSADAFIGYNVIWNYGEYGILSNDGVVKGNYVVYDDANSKVRGSAIRELNNGTVEANVIRNWVANAINVVGGSATIKNNVTEITDGESVDWGLRLDNDCTETVVRGNTVPGTGSTYNGPIRFGSDDATLVRNNEGIEDVQSLTGDGIVGWQYALSLVDASSNAVTATLPDPTAFARERVMVKAIDVTNTATVAPNGSESIDGANSSVTLSSQYDSYVFESDGTDWWVVGGVGA